LSRACQSQQTFEVFGKVKKTFIVRENPNNSFVDKFTLEIPAKFYIEASLLYQAWVDQNLPQSEKDRLAQLLSEFISGAMDEPEKFASENNVDFGSFDAEPYFVFKKSPTAPELLDSYEQEVLADFSQSERFSLEFIGEVVELGDINIENEGFDANDGAALQNHLEQEFEEIGCSNADYQMEVTEHEIKEIIQFSEFKTIIAWKWIRIGCCKTKLYYPKVLTRGAAKVVCVEVMSPDNLGATLKQILEDCGKKAANTSLAVAFIAWVTDDSLDKALIAFKSVFIECVEDRFGEFFSCIVPVIIVKKRVLSGWQDAF